MAWWQIVLEIIKVTTPALIVFLTVYYLMKEYFNKEYNLRLIDRKQEMRGTTLPLRLQAYERLVLFCERIKVENLINRLQGGSALSPELVKSAMVVAIQQEFEHNLSQQVYVTASLWKIIKLAKDQTITNISQMADAAPETSTAHDFKLALLTQASTVESPLDIALAAIRKETEVLI